MIEFELIGAQMYWYPKQRENAGIGHGVLTSPISQYRGRLSMMMILRGLVH